MLDTTNQQYPAGEEGAARRDMPEYALPGSNPFVPLDGEITESMHREDLDNRDQVGEVNAELVQLARSLAHDVRALIGPLPAVVALPLREYLLSMRGEETRREPE